MWERLHHIGWDRLTHAYGWAGDVPAMLANMRSDDEASQREGWNTYWSALNHQGDFYDATAAVIPLLIEALDDPAMPKRDRILLSFRDRW